MAIGDIYRVQINIRNNISAGSAVNVFHFRVVSQTSGIDAENVSDWIVNNYLTAMAAPLPDNWEINQVESINLENALDWNQTNPAISGVKTGTALPTFMAGSVRSPWPGSGYHRAHHRIAGFVVSDLTDSGAWITTAQEQLEDICDAFGMVMSLSGGDLFPCTITPAKPNADPPVPHVFRAYVNGQWEFSIRPTTQRSRLVGGGWTVTP